MPIVAATFRCLLRFKQSTTSTILKSCNEHEIYNFYTKPSDLQSIECRQTGSVMAKHGVCAHKSSAVIYIDLKRCDIYVFCGVN
jgi:hypothetical protein